MAKTVETAESNGKPADPVTTSMFGDLGSLRLSQDFGKDLGVKRVLTTVPVRKPGKEHWFQVHPDEAFRLDTFVIELKEENETYLVSNSLWEELAAEPTFSPRALFTCMNRQNVLFIWPVRLPNSSGKVDSWSESALTHAAAGQGSWIRVCSNMSLGAYERFESEANWPAPAWPELSFEKILEIAFKGHYITSTDHPVLQSLRGVAWFFKHLLEREVLCFQKLAFSL